MIVEGWRAAGDETLFEVESAEPIGTCDGFYVLAWEDSAAIYGTHLESSPLLPTAFHVEIIWSRAFARTTVESKEAAWVESRRHVCVVGPQMISRAQLRELGRHGVHRLAGALLFANNDFFVVIVVITFINVAVARGTAIETPLASTSRPWRPLSVGPQVGMLLLLC